MIFPANPSTGKTLLYNKFRKFQLFNDEIVYLEIKKKNLYIYPLPFSQGCKNVRNQKYKLDAIFFLKKAKQVYVKKISKLEGFKLLFNQIINFSEDRNTLLNSLRICKGSLERVKFYLLNLNLKISSTKVLVIIQQREVGADSPCYKK